MSNSREAIKFIAGTALGIGVGYGGARLSEALRKSKSSQKPLHPTISPATESINDPADLTNGLPGAAGGPAEATGAEIHDRDMAKIQAKGVEATKLLLRIYKLPKLNKIAESTPEKLAKSSDLDDLSKASAKEAKEFLERYAGVYDTHVKRVSPNLYERHVEEAVQIIKGAQKDDKGKYIAEPVDSFEDL